ncbi:MAG: diguanylate cyclase [Desulfovibrionaceae bacterium]
MDQQPRRLAIFQDPRQLFLLWTLCRLAQGGVLLYVWRIHRNFAPARDWGLGALVAVPGLVLLGLRGLVPDWASMLLAYAFVLPGWMLFDFGLIRAAGRHPPWRLGMGTCGLALGFLAWYGLVDPGFSARMLATTAALLVFDGTTAAICLLQRGQGMGLTLRILGGVLLVNILSDLWRASGIADVRPLWLFTPLPAHIQYGFVAILSTVIVTPLLVLLTAQKLQEELRDLACRDPLTSACNRRTLDEVVSDHWPRASASGEPLCCLMLDIDHFKEFNDRYGHQAGDQALVAVSKAARALLRTEDTWCRFGGEEFLALLPRTEAAHAMVVAERLRHTIAALPLDAWERSRRVTVSIGVAEARAESVSWPELVGRCDRALYLAKNRGRNQIALAEADAANLDEAAFVCLTWDPTYACGQQAIDEQHRRLFSASNTLLTALLTGWPKPACQELIEALLAEVLTHFHDEELIFRAAGYAEADAHAAIHQALLDKARTMAEKYTQDALTLGEVFDFLAKDVVSRHMLAEDRKFFPCLRTGLPTLGPRSRPA